MIEPSSPSFITTLSDFHVPRSTTLNFVFMVRVCSWSFAFTDISVFKYLLPYEILKMWFKKLFYSNNYFPLFRWRTSLYNLLKLLLFLLLFFLLFTEPCKNPCTGARVNYTKEAKHVDDPEDTCCDSCIGSWKCNEGSSDRSTNVFPVFVMCLLNKELVTADWITPPVCPVCIPRELLFLLLLLLFNVRFLYVRYFN